MSEKEWDWRDDIAFEEFIAVESLHKALNEEIARRMQKYYDELEDE